MVKRKNLINKIWHLAKDNCQLKGIKLEISFWGLLLCLKEHIKLLSVILNFMENINALEMIGQNKSLLSALWRKITW